MLKGICLLFFVAMSTVGFCQLEDLHSIARKGSYLYYGQPAFEDNSFLLSEAINQEKGVMQYISNLYFDNLKGGDFLYSFTQEIPITHLRHQLNYTLYYHVLNSPTAEKKSSGFGDINIGYSYMVSGKKAWAMVVPGVALILPTGSSSEGHGLGGVGGQLNLAITKRLSHKLVTHYNFGYTFISKADHYTTTPSGTNTLTYEKDIQSQNVGASVIWYQTRKFNWLLEYTSYFIDNINDNGTISKSHQLTVNPGFRFAIDHNRVQIVPGVSTPFVYVDGKFNRMGVFFYLSFEPEYLPFTKAKAR